MRCPQCKNKLIQTDGDRPVKLRTDGPIVYADGLWKSRCFWCKTEVALPIEVRMLPAKMTERYVISERD